MLQLGPCVLLLDDGAYVGVSCDVKMTVISVEKDKEEIQDLVGAKRQTRKRLRFLRLGIRRSEANAQCV